MSKNRQFIKQVKKIYQNISQYPDNIKERRNWLLKTFLVANKREEWVNSGFVLPTISFVSLVLVLLTTAILFRSLERSKNASNVRVNEAVLNAATPAIDRAKAKLNKLFSDARLPRATPTDIALANHFNTYINEYSFGDEKQLKLTHSGEDDLRSAWMYPVDTDNNGKYDTYTLYGIYFKNPPVTNGAYTRSRNPLEARTIPMMGGNIGGSCENAIGTSATLVGDSGWFKVGSKLKKSFFTYTTNVPITNPPNSNYEAYQGNQGFSALEYQQERVQLPLVNNAVVYEDDLAISPGATFNLNGRIITNSNFLTGSAWSTVSLYQISSPSSCFYEADNGKIIVGGNVVKGEFIGNLSNATRVHLFQNGATPLRGNSYEINNDVSVTQNSTVVAYNGLAYAKRINLLVDAQMAKAITGDPTEVKQGITDKQTKQGLASPSTYTQTSSIRRTQLEYYFKRRTRRVPYAEVAFADTETDSVGTYTTGNVLGTTTGDTLRPPNEWIYPFDPNNGTTATGYAELTLKENGANKLRPSATEPDRLVTDNQGNEQYVGDRIALGNNLPELWWNGTRFVGSAEEDTQDITGRFWDDPDNTNADNIRTRRTQVQQLPDLGEIGRNGEWELAAAEKPDTPQDAVGGLRVVTGAGIYLPDSATHSTADFSPYTTTEVWSDLQPAKYDSVPADVQPFKEYYGLDITYKVPQPSTGTAATEDPYLKMRATAVYHYESASYSQTDPTPIACVSSYYDPTNSTTAKNLTALPAWSSDANSSNANGKSNNGIAYPAPSATVSTYRALLDYQATLTYNGRLVNEPLKEALDKSDAGETLLLADHSAIDSALCAIDIMAGATPNNSVVPHGAIYETAFLDPRQVKAIDVTKFSGDYDLPKKDREPLEIRSTVLDLQILRTTTIGTPTLAVNQEYLLPNSGIIYATRDDALADQSAGTTEAAKLESPVDYKLDPDRRPNAIMLINGEKLWRVESYRDVEKGLILASNLPVYIKGNFNLHQSTTGGVTSAVEEFDATVADDWGNFYDRSTLNTQFACRAGDPRLGTSCNVGDEWRSAAVLGDAVTLLSDNFRFGFRNEGDYDYKLDPSTLPAGLETYFSEFNSFVPTFAWYDDDSFPKDLDTTTDGFQGSSYLNNFVTPIMRWQQARDYAYEICPQTNVSLCSDPKMWIMTNTNTDPATYAGQGQSSWNNGGRNIEGTNANAIKTGTVGTPPSTNWDNPNYPRRIAFKRDMTTGDLVSPLQVYGVTSGNPKRIEAFPFPLQTGNMPQLATDASNDPIFIPWMEVNTSTGNWEKPILQIDRPLDVPPVLDGTVQKITKDNAGGKHKYWLQVANDHTVDDSSGLTWDPSIVNLIIAAGDTPAHPGEDNGGLQNFVRFIENWEVTSTPIQTKITGSFMQIGRSKYATAPYEVSPTSNFYPIDTARGKAPYFKPPGRLWGYDVALLSQSPDYFAQKLVRIPDDEPDEYFREVGRDDTWVETLLCAKNFDGDDNAGNDTFAINNEKQRPDSCQDP
ncbi:MAG: hormogonium polysaccharide biosynthesis protein HpsA [Calothrix sp. MO_167.B42]|nr:hormogonium polysaccharide biosynthesis protein HpsA [Calothrix sp. MO_167.B42]